MSRLLDRIRPLLRGKPRRCATCGAFLVQRRDLTGTERPYCGHCGDYR